MPISYTVDTERRLVLETWRGDVDASQLGEYWTKLLDDEQAVAIRRNLSDLSDCEIRLTTEEMWSLVSWILIPRQAGRKWATAIVVGKPSTHSISRHFQAFADTFSHDQIFTDYAAAYEWILRQEIGAASCCAGNAGLPNPQHVSSAANR